MLITNQNFLLLLKRIQQSYIDGVAEISATTDANSQMITKLNTTVAKVRSDLDTTTVTVANFDSKIAETAKLVDGAKISLNGTSATVTQVKTEMETTKTAVAQVKTDINTTKATVGQLAETLNSTSTTIGQLKTLIDANANSIQSMGKLISSIPTSTIPSAVSSVSVVPTIVGSVAQMLDSGFASEINTSLVSVANSSLKLININNKWYYYNATAGLNSLISVTTTESMSKLTSNIDQLTAVYANPTVVTGDLLLTDSSILYYKDFISKFDAKELNVYNCVTSPKLLLWANDHNSNNYYTYTQIVANKSVTSVIVPGPDVQIDMLSFIETKANTPIIRININTPGTYKFAISSPNSEFTIGTIGSDYYIMATKNLNFADYSNPSIKVTLTIDDGKFTYNRTYFINIVKTITSSADITTTRNESALAYIMSVLSIINSGAPLTESFIMLPLNSVLKTDNCVLIDVVGYISGIVNAGMLNIPAIQAVIDKFNSTINLFRSAKTLAEFKQYTVSMRESVVLLKQFDPKYGFSELAHNLGLFAEVYEWLFNLIEDTLVPATFPIPYRISKFLEFTKKVNGVERYYVYRTAVVNSLSVMVEKYSLFTNGLIIQSYINNTQNAQGFYYNNTTDNTVNNGLTWFTGKSPIYTNSQLSQINFHKNGFGNIGLADQPNNVAVSVKGHFKTSEKGIWRFMLGTIPSATVTSNYSNDNLAMMWFGINESDRTIANASLTVNRDSYKTNGGTDASPNTKAYIVELDLDANIYYPIFINWACAGSTTPVLCFGFAKPSAPNTFITDGTGYFWS
jgi:hypothetical protein